MHTSKAIEGVVHRRTTGQSGTVLEVVKQAKARVLIIEDDSQLLSGLQRMLRGQYDVSVACDGQSARNLIAQQEYSALLMDLSIPGVGGCELLTYARDVAPDAMRIVMSGEARLETITTAMNEGRLFRYLQKPFAPAALFQSIADAVEEHRRLATHHELLESTQAASIGALVDLLAITQPGTRGRPARIKQVAENMATELGIREVSVLGIAAQLALVGQIIVPRETFLRAQRRVPLSLSEQELMNRMMPFVEQLVESMPRFEQVRAIIRSQYDAEGVSDDRIHRLAKVLRTSIAFESLENEGLCAASALERLKRSGDYDEEMLEVLGWTSCTEARPRSFVRTKSARTVQRSEVVRAPAPPEATNNTCISERDPVDDNVLIMPLAEVIKGMRFASDVLTSGGVVLVPRGQVVTSRLVERIGSAWSSFAYGLHVRIMRPQPDENQQPGFSLVV